MARTIKIKCNGPGKHVNEVDLEKALKKDIVLRATTQPPVVLPERVVLSCRECTQGKVIVTREMLEQNAQGSHNA